MKSFLRNFWLPGVAVLCVALAYSGALQSAFLFDAYSGLIEDERLTIDGWVFDDWRTAALSTVGDTPHQPLTRLSFSAHYVVFGEASPTTIKVVNFLLHLLTAALVYGLALAVIGAPLFKQREISKRRFFAIAAAAIWMLLPLHVSTVLSAVQRATQLSTVFTILGLLVFLRYRLRWAEQGATAGELMAGALWLALPVFGVTWSGGDGFQLLVLCFVVEATLFRGRFPLFMFALLFFLVVYMLEPRQALGMMVEQGNYLASVGLCLLLAQLLTTPARWNRRVGLWTPLGTVLAVLMLLLFFRTEIWSDQLSLAQANVVNHPSSATARYLYADALLTSHRQRQELGKDMNNDEGRALVVASREQLLRAQEGASGDIPTLLMLLYVDGRFFPGMPKQTDWISMLATAGQETAIEARGLSALSLLLECVGSRHCDVSHTAVEVLLDKLIARNPGNFRLPIMKYEYLAALGVSQERRMALLERVSAVSRNPYVERYRVLENGQRGDVAGMYEVVRGWLANDPQREDLPFIMPLFDTTRDVIEPKRASGT